MISVLIRLVPIVVASFLPIAAFYLIQKIEELHSGSGIQDTITVVGVLSLIYILVVSIYIWALLQVFQKENRKEFLLTLLASYFSLIVTFSAVYFVCFAIVDFYQARVQYKNSLSISEKRKERAKAIHGIDLELWAINSREKDLSKSIAHNSGEKINSKNIVFNSQNRIYIYFDCLYFSVVTMSTLGYGDLYPIHWIVKFFAVLQIITVDLFIIVLGVGAIYAIRRD